METSAKLLIALKNAAFGYNRQPVLENLSLTVSPGEFIGLIGPNGAGKTTLFKGMLKLIKPLSGEVHHAPDLAGKIGYVPQRDQLDAIYPLVARDVVRMGIVGTRPWYHWTGSSAYAGWIEQCLEKVGMGNFRNHHFAELSGGQRQRILIARALALQPTLLVLDEPTAGIDPVAAESILTLLHELNQQNRMTILMVSHHVQILRSRVNGVMVVNNRTVMAGSAEDMLRPERMAELLAVSL